MIINIVILLLISGLLAPAWVPMQDSEKKQEGLIGPVRRIQIDRAKLSGSKSGTQEVERIPWRKLSFDTRGRTTEDIILSNGLPLVRRAYAYDDANHNIEETEYQGNKVFSRSIAIQDSNGNTLTETRYNSEDLIVGKWVYNYNTNGKLEKIIFYNQFGEEVGKKTLIYDEEGGKIEVSEGLHNRSNAHKRISFYDRKGHLVRVDAFDPDGRLLDKSVFRYDGDGNLIEDIRYDGKEQVVSRSLLSYDSQSRLLNREDEEYTANGPSRSALRYEYDLDTHGNWTRRTALKRIINPLENGSEITEMIYRSITYY